MSKKPKFAEGVTLLQLPGCFNDPELGRIYKISKLAYDGSCLLACEGKGGLTPISKNEIHAKIGLHRTKFTDFWNKLIENKIVKSVSIHGINFFCISPLYFYSDTIVSEVFAAFLDELKKYSDKQL